MPRGFRIGYARAVRMSGDGATYAVTGQSAGLNRGWTVAAAAGSYATTGQDASFSIGGSPASSSIALFYTDLAEGPNTGGLNNHGVFIRLFGRGFGATRGSGTVTLNGVEVASYFSWSDTEIAVQPGAGTTSGNFVVTNSSGQSTRVEGLVDKPDGSSNDFTVRAGPIYFISPSGSGPGTHDSPAAPSSLLSLIDPGVTVYFRGGSYTTRIGQTNWSDYNVVLGASNSGTAGNSIQFVGYPGETAAFSGWVGVFHFRDSGSTAQDPAIGYFTVANLDMTGSTTCVGGGGYTSGTLDVYHSGARSVRVVNNRCRATYGAGANTATGLISLHHDGWRVLGNLCEDTGIGTPVNNNHIIYNQCGAGDNHIAYNVIRNVRVGHVIQVHTDTPFVYLDVRIHDNLIVGADVDACRGINFGEVASGTAGKVYNNVLSTLGQDGSGITGSGIAIYGGNVDVFNNTLHNINGHCLFTSNVQGGTRNVVIRNNILWSDGVVSAHLAFFSAAEVTVSHNLYFNGGSPYSGDSNPVTGNPLFVNPAALDFTLQSSSPARNAGSSSVSTVVTHDRNGVSRPQGAAFDIGAYEYV